MVRAGCVQTLLTCAKAQERRAMLPDGFSVGYIRLGTRLSHILYIMAVQSHNGCSVTCCTLWLFSHILYIMAVQSHTVHYVCSVTCCTHYVCSVTCCTLCLFSHIMAVQSHNGCSVTCYTSLSSQCFSGG